MLKSIVANPVGRKFIATAMFSTAVMGAGVVSLNANENIVNKSNTEFVDISTARALASNAISLETFSFEHNKKLDKVYLKECETERTSRAKRDDLRAIYNIYGTFGGTIELQRMIDDCYIDLMFKGYLEHFSLVDNNRANVLKIQAEFCEWRDNEFYKDLYLAEQKMYAQQEYPSAEKAIKFIDSHIHNSKYFIKDDVKIYNDNCERFKSKQTDKVSVQAKADLLAYKTHILNVLAFKNYLEKVKVPKESILSYYFKYDFMNSKNCVKP